ncbi:CRISPR-associated RAMP Cmr4 [Porphyromonas crevioricanis JCM 15906]|uniref:CRISPR-associated RAMP Cmr4 n=1 Tax=Porphyromonas crevioricanis JCM 15906 TaxID=1305617 RepID=T1DTN3_9PORP|nr:type III-B CRISPR module RAMP protein Cmr4 [Porphyromonas crevioricanis]GAD05914.1 CRISPR-associated RAMP Cmr4 [Porphyromonas crevioricanis JCM 15906]SKA03409.1 CRISPR-associated protein, Cmr4 family [Porphyromonas crevioricanis]
MKTATYVIRCLTNMHVGKGDATYEVVDKCVQRDVTTGVPCIYSSSLKGALRQFFSKKVFADSKQVFTETDLNYVFGSDVNRDKKNNSDKKNEEEHSIGNFTFFQANLLAYPVQSKQNESGSYKLRTNKALQKPIEELAKLLSAPFNAKGMLPEEHEETLSNEHLEQLPVIARNQLDNGESKNLWYEEVVPAESRFVFFVSYDNEDIFKEFNTKIQEGVIQIGANGSIGYGFCKITNLKDSSEK